MDDMAWYLFHAPGYTGVTRLSAERAAELRAMGHRLDPAEPPPDLAQRLGDLLAGLCWPLCRATGQASGSVFSTRIPQR